jgi:hypothetical protein
MLNWKRTSNSQQAAIDDRTGRLYRVTRVATGGWIADRAWKTLLDKDGQTARFAAPRKARAACEALAAEGERP